MFRAGWAARSKAAAEIAILYQLSKSLRDRVRPLRRDQDSATGIHYFEAAAERRGDNRKASVKRFDKCDPESFRRNIRLTKDVRCREDLRDVRALAHEADLVRDSQRARCSLEFSAVGNFVGTLCSSDEPGDPSGFFAGYFAQLRERRKMNPVTL
jgi:hypothetical protein